MLGQKVKNRYHNNFVWSSLTKKLIIKLSHLLKAPGESFHRTYQHGKLGRCALLENTDHGNTINCGDVMEID